MITVLIIDGDKLLCKMMALTLRQAGYNVALAGNGNVGLEKAHNSEVDLIITDLMLPEMDGLNLLDCLRNELKLSTPILVYTGIVTPDIKEQVINAGANFFLYKPSDPTRLLAKVKEMENLL